MRRALGALAAVTLAVPALAAGPADADTKAWWKLIGQLSSDTMQGRDTGSPGHARAVDLVADAFKAAGLQPMGDKRGYRQTVPLHESRVESAGTRFAIRAPDGRTTVLHFLHDATIRATDALPEQISAPLVFRGYCGASEVGTDVAGKIVLCFGGRRAAMPGAAARLDAVAKAGAVGLINIDDVGYTQEQPNWFWPAAYARSIDRRGAAPPAHAALPVIRLNAAALPVLLAGSGHDADALLAAGIAVQPLPGFDLATRLEAELTVSQRDFTSDNVLALLPGTDPALAGETIVIDAHLDGFGIGEPVKGDAIYNGAFDDAAYVATLVRLAKARAGKGFRRPVLFAVFTGEEKGLLGSRWFVDHPSVPREQLAAAITLDAIRPLFPLKILTVIGSDKSNLIRHVETVAAPMGITPRPDLEPVRGMITRTDASPFLGIGVPAIAFMFGYDPGSHEEARFRTWYRTRYHKPQDDIGQPIDFSAALAFNRFFDALTEHVADAPERPVMTPAATDGRLPGR